ncbi:MAG: HigA family addiction module antidote protein [Parcubacteria group bacterium]|nr:HigA family addiction module antidote protein [Parcubacteria group bacterium]
MSTRLQRRRVPTHPGEILREEFMKPYKLSVIKLARILGISRKHLSTIVNERARITAPLAVRLSRFFGTTAELWMNLQSGRDLIIASRHLEKQIAKIKPIRRIV